MTSSSRKPPGPWRCGALELIAVSTANMRPWEDSQRAYARARAMENNLFVAVANCIGSVGDTEFFGGSIITDPYRARARGGGRR